MEFFIYPPLLQEVIVAFAQSTFAIIFHCIFHTIQEYGVVLWSVQSISY